MTILHKFSGVAAIFFPVGKINNEGTCEFATKKCLLECAAIHHNPEDQLEIIGHGNKKRIYDFIINEPVFKVCAQIIRELKKMKCNILYWFASGDCTSKDEDKILKIMQHLNNEDIIQLGFTRNKSFWDKNRWQGIGVTSLANIVLTIESYKAIQKLQSDGLFAVPNYKTKMVTIYKGKDRYVSCGSIYVINKLATDSRKSNCLECYNQKLGCFTELKENI